MQISHLDHLVLTVKNIEVSVNFYTEVLGMKKILFAGKRVALAFGQQKINLHELGKEFEPKAGQVSAGSADLCFISQTPIEDMIEELQTKGIQPLEGPVQRNGAQGPIISIYLRDPDANLIEISNYLAKGPV